MTQKADESKVLKGLMFLYDAATERAEKEGMSHREAFRFVCETMGLMATKERLSREVAGLEHSKEITRKAIQLYDLAAELFRKSREAVEVGNLEEGDRLYKQGLDAEGEAIGRELQAAKEKKRMASHG